MWSATFLVVLLLWSEPHLGFAKYGRNSPDADQLSASLDDLGAQIEDDVEESLLPVYALAIKDDMANGIGGTTIATYNGRIPLSFVITNGHRSVCDGTIRGPNCNGVLRPFRTENREDYCYAKSYAVVDNIICLSSGPITVIANKNRVFCNSTNNSPTLILNEDEFRNLCGDRTSAQTVYTYYANSYDPRAIPIPNSNPHVKCRNSQPGVCEFEANINLPSI